MRAIWDQNSHTHTYCVFGSRTCVVLCFQVQVVQFVNVADVHLLFVQLCFVEVLTWAVGGARMIQDKERERERENYGNYTEFIHANEDKKWQVVLCWRGNSVFQLLISSDFWSVCLHTLGRSYRWLQLHKENLVGKRTDNNDNSTNKTKTDLSEFCHVYEGRIWKHGCLF